MMYKNKSAGHDGIGKFIVKKVTDEILEPLLSISNLSISTGVVPNNLKTAKVIPIHKKDPTLCSKNRPVSALVQVFRKYYKGWYVIGALNTLLSMTS